MSYKDKDELLDGLWDHLFPKEEDEDPEYFEHVAKFFDQFDDSGGSGSGSGSGSSAPRRRARQSSGGGNQNTTSRRRSRTTSSDTPYGNSRFFGN